MRLLIGLYALYSIVLVGLTGYPLAVELFDVLEGILKGGGPPKRGFEGSTAENFVIGLFFASLTGGVALGLWRRWSVVRFILLAFSLCVMIPGAILIGVA